MLIEIPCSFYIQNQNEYRRLARYHYIMEYSKKYNFPTKKSRTTCYMMSERIHKLVDDIEPSISDENLQPSESDGELIKPYLAIYN